MLNNIRDIIYPVHTFSELKMKLDLAGINTTNLDRREFDICHPDDWKWTIYCHEINDCVEHGIDLRNVAYFSSIT